MTMTSPRPNRQPMPADMRAHARRVPAPEPMRPRAPRSRRYHSLRIDLAIVATLFVLNYLAIVRALR